MMGSKDWMGETKIKGQTQRATGGPKMGDEAQCWWVWSLHSRRAEVGRGGAEWRDLREAGAW